MAKIAIVGAGIFGVTAALELSRRGFEVSLLDRGEIPNRDASSTDISKVLRMDYGADAFYLGLMARAFDGWDAWNDLWGEELYHQTGVLMLSRDEMKPGGYEHDSYHLLLEHGYPVERITAEEIRKRFPAWNADRYPDGYFNPRGGWAESGRVVEHLLATFQNLGGKVIQGAQFDQWITEGDKLTGIRLASQEKILADNFVLAAGAWTPQLLPRLKSVMWPTAQDLFHFRVPDKARYQPPEFPVYTADVSRTGWYGFPAKDDGTLKVANHGVGRKMDPSGLRTVQESSLAKYYRFFEETFPGLVNAPKIYERVCFYADTFDGDFWISRDPEWTNLTVSSGGSGHGFKFAPVLGKITADVLEAKANPDALRFAWRDPGDLKTEFARFNK